MKLIINYEYQDLRLRLKVVTGDAVGNNVGCVDDAGCNNVVPRTR
jgi:hypothetical protein